MEQKCLFCYDLQRLKRFEAKFHSVSYFKRNLVQGYSEVHAAAFQFQVRVNFEIILKLIDSSKSYFFQ